MSERAEERRYEGLSPFELKNKLIEMAGEEIAAAFRRLDFAAMSAAVSDEMLDAIAIAGRPDEVRDRVIADWQAAETNRALNEAAADVADALRAGRFFIRGLGLALPGRAAARAMTSPGLRIRSSSVGSDAGYSRSLLYNTVNTGKDGQ